MTRSQRPVWLGEDRRVWDHIRVHIALLDDPRIGPYDLAVYAGITRHAEVASGAARPATATLARYGGMSERRVRTSIETLAECGYIDVKGTPGKASTYVLLPPPTPAPHAGVVETEGPPTPAPHADHPGTTCRPTPAPRADEQEPVEQEPGNEKDFAAAPLVLVTDERQDPSYGFERFWSRYPARNGKKVGKAKALDRWRKLSYDDKASAWRGVQHYAAHCDGGMNLAKDAERWVRDRCWLDWQEPAAAGSQLSKREQRIVGNGRADLFAEALGLTHPPVHPQAITTGGSQ